MKEDKNVFKMLSAKPRGKKPPGMPRRALDDNIRMYLKDLSVSTGNWIHSAQD